MGRIKIVQVNDHGALDCHLGAQLVHDACIPSVPCPQRKVLARHPQLVLHLPPARNLCQGGGGWSPVGARRARGGARHAPPPPRAHNLRLRDDQPPPLQLRVVHDLGQDGGLSLLLLDRMVALSSSASTRCRHAAPADQATSSAAACNPRIAPPLASPGSDLAVCVPLARRSGAARQERRARRAPLRGRRCQATARPACS